MSERRKKNLLVPGPQKKHTDLVVSMPVESVFETTASAGNDRLIFDGYKLRWLGSSPAEYCVFSGQADLSARESKKDLGPTPQGLFAADPANIEELEPSDDWGNN